MSEKTRVTLPAEDLRALFDLAVGSMDFGSGFWETSDVETARKIAAVLGVDPMEGTPGKFRTHYRHAYVDRHVRWRDQHQCKWCEGHEDDWQHQEEVVER